jgi:hypothetical protein
MIPVSLFYVLISWVVVLLLKFVMDQLFESQSYEILDNQTQFFQEHSTETDKLCVETLKLKDKLCLLSLFFFIIFIPHICIFSFSHTWLFNNIQSSASTKQKNLINWAKGLSSLDYVWYQYFELLTF